MTEPDDGAAVERKARSLEWAVDVGRRRSSLAFYRVVRGFIRLVLFRWLRVEARGAGHLATPGPVIIAPVHRSNLDAPLIASAGPRRMRALGKQSLFVNPVSAWVCAALGAIPLRRGEADRDAMRSARTILDDGEVMIVFPEGTRQSGSKVAGVFDGMSYLASKTGDHRARGHRGHRGGAAVRGPVPASQPGGHRGRRADPTTGGSLEPARAPRLQRSGRDPSASRLRRSPRNDAGRWLTASGIRRVFMPSCCLSCGFVKRPNGRGPGRRGRGTVGT
ncbi:MAG: lysophospholipid acyltransferase family protein [Acidimicrobiales bacterium]